MLDSPPSPGSDPGALPRLVALYHRTLLDDPSAGAWLRDHGLTEVTLWSRHQLGFANGSLLDLLPRYGPVRDNLVTLGVLGPDGQECFAGCLIIPVFDPDGRILNLWGWPLAGGPMISLPGRPRGIWNLAALRIHTQVNVVESVLDALSAHQAGCPNTLALECLESGDEHWFRELGVQRVSLFTRERVNLPTVSCDYRSLPEAGTLNTLLVQEGPNLLPHRQVQQLLARIDTTTPAGVRDRAMIEVLYSSGLRAAELLGLKLGDVDWTNATARVTGKGNKQRVVPIGRTALRVLTSYVQGVRPGLVRQAGENAMFLDDRG